jgi:hypothetical protein
MPKMKTHTGAKKNSELPEQVNWSIKNQVTDIYLPEILAEQQENWENLK